MARYGVFRYGVEPYGDSERATASSSVLAQVLDYGLVRLVVYARSRVQSRYVLVRTKTGAAEEPSSGITIRSGVILSPQFEVFDGRDNFLDTEAVNNVAVPVGPVYYTLFVFDEGGNWYKDAATYTVVPRDRNSVRLMLGLLPRVFTTKTQDPLDYPDETGDLFRFLKGFAVSLDEVQTYIDRVLPSAARSRTTLAGLHDAHCRSVGMPVEYILGLGSTSRLFRDAGLTYQNKGKVRGVQYFAEALTGWSIDVRNSPNRMLSLDDSSFESSLGAWSASGGTLTRLATGAGIDAPASDYDSVLDPVASSGVARLTLTSATARMNLEASPPQGEDEPSSGRSTYRRLSAVPVASGQTVYVSAYVKAGTSTTFTPIVTWLDEQGQRIGSEVRGTSEAVSTPWERVARSFVAPATGRFMLLSLEFTGSTSSVVYVDKIQVADTSTHFHDAQSVDVLCHPARVNLLTRPSVGSSGLWSATRGSIQISSGDAYIGTYSLLANGTAGFEVTSELVPAIPGSILSASAFIKGSASATMDIVFLNASNAIVTLPTISQDMAEIVEIGIPASTTGSGNWEKVQARYLVPAGATKARVRITGNVGGTRIDAVIMERTDRQQYYFDISIADAGSEDAMAVAQGASTYSLLYPARLSKLSRLRSTLTHYLPIGVSSRVLLWSDTDPYARSYVPYQP